MIFSGLELLGEIPFTDVIIHSTILATDGRRMSKSLGNGVDPMEPIEEHGADATRYGLLKISSTQDVRFSYGAIEEGRKLANKLWNVSRLILQRAEGAAPEARPRDLEERWILARIDAARAELEDDWGRFDFASSTDVLYHLSSTTSATGTRRRSSRGCTRTTPMPPRRPWRRWSDCSGSSTP